MSVIGDNIKALRSREGLTQQEFADAIHVTRETVNKWESGIIEALREHNAQTICERFGLAPDDLKSETRGLSSQLRLQSLQDGRAHSEAGKGPKAPAHFQSDAIWLRHPHAFFVEMDSSMTRVLPAGSLAVVDPDTPASSGSLVAVDVPGDDGTAMIVRRMQRGSTKTLLSAESYEECPDDLVIDNADLCVRGTVGWYQPPRELA
ncbi:MAG: helix-turn-helix domain-containing protein [Atopobiaceae bacterium]|nr:helix-turn-helix domain-containing protein [Atopobiaceae bacterium]